MSVRDAGTAIREARKKAKFSQEKLSEGVCSLRALSRIENGTSGISPSTFQALMEHAKAPCSEYPVFENKTDYECFSALKHARFHLDAWQLDAAWEELYQLETNYWNRNRFYHQEWLLLHATLQKRSGTADPKPLLDLLEDALAISRPQIDLDHLTELLLSSNEIELLAGIARESAALDQTAHALRICTQLSDYLGTSGLSFPERDRLLAECAIAHAECLIARGDYAAARQIADRSRRQMILNHCDAPLLELTFLTGLCDLSLGHADAALAHFKNVFYSAHAIGSPYATTCRKYIEGHADLAALPDVPQKSYRMKKRVNSPRFTNGIFDASRTYEVTIGSLIHKLRTKQKITQDVLCQGLCSRPKLSKIESGILKPEIILAETLLQRLGISAREFVFWGNSKEAKFHELRARLSRKYYELDTDHKRTLAEMEALISDKDVLMRQYLLYEKSYLVDEGEEHLALLEEALHCTLKNFDISRITEYRLSWMELTLLNNIAFNYRYTSTPQLGIYYFEQILTYHRKVRTDCILQSQTLAVTFHLLSRLYYNKGFFEELNDFLENNEWSITRYRFLRHEMVNFYYSQSLGECGRFEKISLPARYSCALARLLEDDDNSDVLQQAILEDFSIDISY